MRRGSEKRSRSARRSARFESLLCSDLLLLQLLLLLLSDLCLLSHLHLLPAPLLGQLLLQVDGIVAGHLRGVQMLCELCVCERHDTRAVRVVWVDGHEMRVQRVRMGETVRDGNTVMRQRVHRLTLVLRCDQLRLLCCRCRSLRLCLRCQCILLLLLLRELLLLLLHLVRLHRWCSDVVHCVCERHSQRP